jgi:thioredoxin-related protein
MGPDIFDRTVDAEALIASAIVRAAPRHRTIMLLMDANWCPWCRRLHQAITENPEVAALLNRQFILVYVDVSTRNDRKRNARTVGRFGNPVQEFGLPVFVVLDARGNKVGVRETSSLSAPTDEEVSRKLLAFLRNSIPSTPKT